jgi:hypothetical protein
MLKIIKISCKILPYIKRYYHGHLLSKLLNQEEDFFLILCASQKVQTLKNISKTHTLLIQQLKVPMQSTRLLGFETGQILDPFT